MTLRRPSLPGLILLSIAAALIALAACAEKPAPLPAGLPKPPTRLADLQPLFADPPAEYRSAPLWVWNDRVTEAEIDEQLADFKAKGIGGVFVHPRPGLITPYLTPEWIGLFQHAVEKGKSLGMKIWIYDENSYPSGFAGGHVPAAMPDAARSGLRMTKMEALPAAFESEPVVVLRRTDAGFEDITARLKTEKFGPGAYIVYDINAQKPSPWFGGYTYVDIMRPDVTAKFLELTLDPYKAAFGAEFGAAVPGSFQDEAEISPAGGQGMTVLNWTPRLFAAFQAKFGYDLRPSLPSLTDDVGDFKAVRHDFYALLLDLFIEGWAKPYFEYAQKNNLAFTGHYWEHEWPRPVSSPDNLAMAAWSHMPGIDILMNDFQRDTHAQFGNARAVKEIRSAANQMGLPRTMSETYGAGGWDLTFFDQKRIADWELALGVNFINQHLSYVTIMGARKRDHPQSFSYHEPWWGDYKMMGDYLGRLSLVVSSGRQDNRILVLEPTTTAWMHHKPGGDTDAIKAIGKDFQAFVDELEAAQVEYDLGSEDTLRAHGRVDGKTLRIGPQTYDVVVLPPGLENLERPSVDLLGKLLAKGGRVLALVPAPAFVAGRPDKAVADLAAKHAEQWMTATPAEAPAKLAEILAPALRFTVAGAPAAMPNMLFHHRRTFADGELVFLANIDPAAGIAGELAGPGKSVSRWDPLTGKIEPYPSQAADNSLKAAFNLPPGGSLVLVLSPEPATPVPAPANLEWADAAPGAKTVIARAGGNILTLDYCDLTVGGKTEKDLYFYDAQLKTYRAHGLDRNPWDSAVQYKTNILDKDKFAADSGFEATFHFRVAPGVAPAALVAVIERPGLFHVSCNGKPVEPKPGEWWLDKAFGVFPLTVKPGDNTITLKAAPFTIHSELEPIYLVGDFAVKGEAKGFQVVPPAALSLGPWSGQGMPMESGRVDYSKTIDVPAEGPGAARYRVALGAWLGAEAEIRVNGKKAGLIAFAPFELDITGSLQPGRNEVTVAVIGTLKNTLGPFHNNPQLGRAWPGSFQQGAKGGRPAGKDYSVVGYGLFEDFKVQKTR
ncbi:MAG: glycosyl hydrolase [Candidatus Aminicenantes bacterium]|nr:glycosyl hydrolase [Candidatus Aminicenantes bacterium]